MKKLSIYSLIFLLSTPAIPAFLGASEVSQGDAKSSAALETVAIKRDLYHPRFLPPTAIYYAHKNAVPVELQKKLDAIFNNTVVSKIFADLQVGIKQLRSHRAALELCEEKAYLKFTAFLKSAGFERTIHGQSESVYFHNDFPDYIFKMGFCLERRHEAFNRVAIRDCIMADLAYDPILAGKLIIPTKQLYVVPVRGKKLLLSTISLNNILFEQCIVVASKVDLPRDSYEKMPSDLAALLRKHGVTDFRDYDLNWVHTQGTFIVYDLGPHRGKPARCIKIPRPTYDAIQAELAKRGTKPQRLTDLEFSIYPTLTSAECEKYSKLKSYTASIKFLLNRDPTSKIYNFHTGSCYE